MVLTLLPLSAFIAFAADESITVTSIEIEAIKPDDGVKAKIDEIRIKSVNGDTSLADQVSFKADKLFWAEVPNLDPSTWGDNWSKFTGTFEEGKIYALHFALQSAQPVASSCAVTVYEPNGNPWWQDDIASQDATYVVADAAHEIARELHSIVVEMPGSIIPTVGGTPITTLTVKSVNGDESLVDVIGHFECDWYYNTEYSDNIDHYTYYDRPEFIAGYSYESYFYMETVNENDVFAEDCVLTVKTPSGDITIPIYSDSGNDWADFSKRYPVLEGDGLKHVGDVAITLNGYEQGKPVTDVTLNAMQENFTIDATSIEIYDDCDIVEAGEFQYQTYYAVFFDLKANDGYTFMVKDGRFRNITVNGIRANIDGPYYDDLGGYEYVEVFVELPILFESAAKPDKIELELGGYEIGGVAENVEITGKHDGFDLHVEPGEYNYCFWFEGADRDIDDEEAFEKDGKYLLALYMFPNKVLDLSGMQNEDFTLNGIVASNYRIGTDYDSSDVGYNESIRLEFELPTLHLAGEAWEYDENDHWNECDCTERMNVSSHEDTDNNGKCDICDYLLVDVTPIYDVKLILNNYAVGKKVSDINVIVPAGAKYKVVSFEVCDIMSGNPCAPTDVIAIDKGYIIDVELEAELGYKIIGELNSLMNMCPNVTLNGIMGYRDGWNCFRFFMPDFATSTTPYPKGEIKLNGYQLGAKAEDITVTMPNGYEIFGGIGSGFMFFDAYTEGVITEFGTGFYAVSIVFYPNSDYDSSTFSKDTLTLCGQEAEFVMQTPMNYQVTYYLPLAPAATDAKIEKVEVSLNGYGIGVHTSAVTVTANDYTGIDVLEGCFIEDSIIWTELEGGIEAGKKYLYQVGIAASEGFTLSSIRPETFTLNGKTPVDFTWEEGFLIAVFETDALGTTPEPGTTPGGTDTPADPDNSSDENDGLGAGAIVAIVIGSLVVLGGGGFALYWFVLRKKPLLPTDPTTPVEEAPENDVDTDTEKDAEATDTEDAPETEDKKDTE